MKLEVPSLPWPVWAGLAVLFAAVVYRAAGGTAAGAGQALGRAAVDAAGGVVSGVAFGVGDAIGVPRTEESACQQALRAGRWWDASFACPAGTFISGAWRGITD